MRVLLDIGQSLRIALGAIRANKARGALTTLGIIIGIVAVIITMTAANGLQRTFQNSFASVGADVIYVSRLPWIIMDDFFLYRNRPQIELEQAEDLGARLRGKAIVNPSMATQRDVKFHSDTMESVLIIGTTDKQPLISSAQPEIGRFITEYDANYNKRVCVIGSDVRDGLFGEADPLHKTIHIGRNKFRVIGVMEEQGGGFMGGPNFDRRIYVPIGSYMKAFGGGHGRQGVDIAVKAPSREAMGDLEYTVIGEMRKIRKLRPVEGDDFSVNKLDTLLGAFNNVMGVVLLIGLIITGISLFVGGVGVMNIMFVSVTERTREIGIRKAIGARRRTILMQFLLESAAICLLGGLVGILVASLLTAVINAVLMPATVSLPILIIAVVIAIAVGVLAGLVPAYRGSKLNPIDALRYE